MIIKKHLKQAIVGLCCIFLFSCSVNQEESISFSAQNNTYSTRGFVIEQPQQITVHVPSSDSVLNKEQLVSGALDAHNSVREKHGLKPLIWSEKLAQHSQEWSDHLGSGKSCRMFHRPGKHEFGENLFIASPRVWNDNQEEIFRARSKVTIRDVVKEWAEEEKWYDYQSNTCQEGKQCGHYTQVVWRDTTEVGCAVTFCPDKSQNWVCSYNPKGNKKDKKPY